MEYTVFRRGLFSAPLLTGALFLSGCGQSEETAPAPVPSPPRLPVLAEAPEPTAPAVTPAIQPILKVPAESPALPMLFAPVAGNEPEPEASGIRKVSRTESVPREELARTQDVRVLFESLAAAHASGDSEQWELAQTRLIDLSGEAQSVVVGALKSSKPQVRELAAMLLPNLGEPRREFLPLLLESLNDDSAPFVQVNVASSLSQSEQQANAVLPVLARLLDSPIESLQQQAAYTVGNYGRAAAPAVPKLVEKFSGASPQLQQAILAALGQIGSGAEQALPTLRNLHANSTGETRITLQATIDQIARASTFPSIR